MRQPARREAGSCSIFFLNSFYMIDTFNCGGELVHTLIDPVHLRQALCFSAIYLISVLQLFTRLEDVVCNALDLLFQETELMTTIAKLNSYRFCFSLSEHVSNQLTQYHRVSSDKQSTTQFTFVVKN